MENSENIENSKLEKSEEKEILEYKESEKKEGSNESKTEIKNFETKVKEWFDKQNWRENPFTLNVIPSIFVGYEEQKAQLIASIEENHKVALLLGATGSGKTTALEWLCERFRNEKRIVKFLPKPPNNLEAMLEFFDIVFKPRWPLSLFYKKVKNINELPNFLNKKLKNKKMFLLVDEAHEADILVLQWFRILIDQVENFYIILSALPNFEETLIRKLETFHKRVTIKIVLRNLTENDVKELIAKRIEYVAKTSKGKNPFTEEAIKAIYEETGGFPREVIRLCSQAVHKAIELSLEKIDASLIRKREESIGFEFSLSRMPKKQREVLEAIRNNKNTPNEILESIDLSTYKSRYHALRSVNNILQRLMREGYVERRKQGKTYYYTLSSKLRTLLVNA
ncbi:MAG: AAA family ATPase [Candidatus Aenigmarchaeota archaeon]|nr:AAA family ATPase [Candidatus Aenigmarchaeota archaeon]